MFECKPISNTKSTVSGSAPNVPLTSISRGDTWRMESFPADMKTDLMVQAPEDTELLQSLKFYVRSLALYWARKIEIILIMLAMLVYLCLWLRKGFQI